MNVASLELCQELYAVSGWTETSHWYDNFVNGKWHVDTAAWPVLEHERDNILPAYDLGYLLDRLPHFIELVQLSGGYTPTGWRAIKKSSQDYWHKGGPIEAEADNPTDAAAKLCIELIKQGIITPEGEKGEA